MTQRIVRRWNRCVLHRGGETRAFIREWFSEESRRTFLLAGAGFDPRATLISEELAQIAGGRISALYLRERRPNPTEELVRRAEGNIRTLLGFFPASSVKDIEIFAAADLAVVGGRNAADFISGLSWSGISDLVIDCSALSRAIIFPVVRTLLNMDGTPPNIHLLLNDQPALDEAILTECAERASAMHGFKGNLGLESTRQSAVLWLPQLVPEQHAALAKIYAFMDPKPHDVCPILPFPSSNLRKPEQLIDEYQTELTNAWDVDPRDVVFADESNPVDLYRTILRIDDERRRVFEQIGGSLMVLSPIGSKLLSLGALMAAIDRDFPVVYVEALNYKLKTDTVTMHDASRSLVHLWLRGDAYAS